MGLVAPRPALCEPGTLWLVLGAGLEALTGVISVPKSVGQGMVRGCRRLDQHQDGKFTWLSAFNLTHKPSSSVEPAAEGCGHRCPHLQISVRPADLLPLWCFHLRKQVFYLLP